MHGLLLRDKEVSMLLPANKADQMVRKPGKYSHFRCVYHVLNSWLKGTQGRHRVPQAVGRLPSTSLQTAE